MVENPRKRHIWKFAAVGLVLGLMAAALDYNGPLWIVRWVIQGTGTGVLLGWLWARLWTPPGNPPASDL